MDQFWPDSELSAQRRNLHQAIYSLRKSLNPGQAEGPNIIFENDCYALDPALSVWSDVEEFERVIEHGNRLWQQQQVSKAVQQYEIAESIYNGTFLPEDMYEDWAGWIRDRLHISYLEIAHKLGDTYFNQAQYSAAIAINRKIIEKDLLDEKAHRGLMRSYIAQDQHHLALRQYRMCTELFKNELDLPLSDETQALFNNEA